MKTKICTGCTKRKPKGSFYRNKNTKDGVQTQCKICMRGAYNNSRNKKKDHYNRVKRTRVNNIKERLDDWKHKQGCTFCTEDDPCCLDLHHLDPNKKDLEVSNLRQGAGWKRLMEEAAKCIIVCRNCHGKIHSGKISV